MKLPNAGELRPYSEMKDSGVEWLGEVPEQWSLLPPKRVLRPEASGTSIIKNTASGEYRTGYVPAFSASGQDIWLPSASHHGDALVLSAVGARCGKTFRTSGDWGVVANTQILRPRKTQNRDFWWYVTNIPDWWERAGAAQPFVRVSSTLNRTWAIPPLTEQCAIVRFLDHADRRIRRYIRAKQKLIALLEEQKQTIIHQAVTGQIDVCTGQPYPAYKPSGVEWLEEVPKHWEMVRNGRLFVQRNEIGFPELPILEVSLKTGVRIRDFENSDRKQAMSDRSMYKRAAKGDIAYNMMRMWQGAVGLTPVDGLVSPAYVIAKPLPGTDPRYYGALFRTRRYMGEVDKFSRGIVKDRNRLYWEDFKQMPAPFPPTDEQAQIARAIDHNTAIIDEGKHRIEGQISFLREYRTRLIVDVVTGKLDVREAAAELPEVEPLAENDLDGIIHNEKNSNLDELEAAEEVTL